MTVGDLKTHLANGGQVLKTRDDHDPVILVRSGDSEPTDQFTLPTESQCSWAKPDEVFGAEKLRPRIEPWLTALVQSEHLALVVGSGLTHAVHWLGTGVALPGMGAVTFKSLDAEITQTAKRTAEAA